MSEQDSFGLECGLELIVVKGVIDFGFRIERGGFFCVAERHWVSKGRCYVQMALCKVME
jgi:hypothetical protein